MAGKFSEARNCNETHTCVSLSIGENNIREIDHSRGGDDELRAGGGR